MISTIMNTQKNKYINTERFLIRDLTKADANYKYLCWLSNDTTVRYINAAREIHDLQHLKKYISTKICNANIRFFGIFEKTSLLHIGNIKYEPINFQKSYAIMGVLIGDKDWRGKNVFGEAFSATAAHLFSTYSVNRIYLGVNKSNLAAIRSYQKAGFNFTLTPPPEFDLASTDAVMVATFQNRN